MSTAFSRQPKRMYEFGPFRLDVAERVLLREGVAVSLPPKVFDTLVVLVENSGRLMEKDELIRTLWPDSFVEEGSLARKISYLRKALEENAQEQKYIETVPKIGYRFIAEVRTAPEQPSVKGLAVNAANRQFVERNLRNAESYFVAPDSTASDRETVPASAPPEASLKKLSAHWINQLLVLGGIVLAILFALGYWLYIQRANQSTPFHSRQTLLATNSGRAHREALSPDGKYLAFALREEAGQSLWIQQTATGSNVQIIPPGANGFSSMTFSPDGNYVFYTQSGQALSLFRIPTLGGQPVKLMDDIGSPPAFSPDGRLMAFVKRDSGKGEVAVMLAKGDGTGERILAVRKLPNRFSPDGLAWSPDGQRIAIAVEDYDLAHRRMRVVAVQVSDGREVPVGSQQWYRVEQVAWTRDGAGVIAIAWDPPNGIFGGQLWYLPWPDGDVRRITNDLNDYEGLSVAADDGLLATIRETRTSYFWLETVGETGRAIEGLSAIGDTENPHLGIAWLADNRIVFGKTVGGNADLWAMDLDGRNQKRLTTNTEADIQPSTSADGSVIVYASFRGNHPHIWRMDADGKNQRQLTEGNDETMPSVSADGRWLFYLSTGTHNGNLRKMPMTGGFPVQVGNFVVSRPVLSPDGKWVAGFMADPTHDERSQLTVLSVNDESSPRTFFPRSFFEQAWVQWSSDSQAIRYLDQKNGVTNLRSQPLDGSPSVPLTNFQSDLIFRFAYSPDGRTLICERGRKERDVVLFKTVPAEP